ncbi:DNA-(apurinic or apyrimidinic site) endonuclease 2 [Caerostris extrusa]|uniref:DNA-(apurinic or apyrimidinic site) endonuclease n=1 Tax=Caerostris extrusa TaxID=172846 RepID=A0AAV4Q1R3_CAEEX|nr:DNA-(apurinic or apyrimidinic site) endonuclease 2 [Caerostris extrusa]
MKIITWNVNGIRTLKSVDCVLNELSADIACFQETKVSRSQIPENTALIEGYTSYFSYPRKHSGYSGVATYCKDTFVPEDAEEGLSSTVLTENYEPLTHVLSFSEYFNNDAEKFDFEGRVIITYHLMKYEDQIQRLAIINVYCPHVDPEKPERYLYKMQFSLMLEAKLKELSETGCSVVILGDLNIAYSVIDHCQPCEEREFNSSKSRQWLKALLTSEISFCDGMVHKIGIVDAFRHFYPDKKESYTCWNTKTGARATNYGTRIDYILVTSNLLPLLDSCEILSDYHGSDHCPVAAIFKCDSIPQENVQLPSICTRLWPEFSGQQQKLQAFFQKIQNVADNLMKQQETELQSFQLKLFNQLIHNLKNCNETSGFSCSPSDSSSSSSSSKHEDSSIDDEQIKSVAIMKKNQSEAWKTMLAGPPKPPLCSGHQKNVF